MNSSSVVVKLDIFAAVNRLESVTRKRYNYTEVANEIGVTRQAAWKMFHTDEPSQVNVETLSGFINWFRRNGIDATPNDFFVMVDEPS